MNMLMGLLGGNSPDIDIKLASTEVNAAQYVRTEPVSASYRIGSDKKVYYGINGDFVEMETWCGPTASPAGYEARATVSGGALTDGPVGAWVNLGASQTWTFAMVGGFAAFTPNTRTLTVEIRNASTLRRVAVATVVLRAQKF